MSTHASDARHGNDIRSGRGMTVLSGRSIPDIGPMTWNSIPEIVRNRNTLLSFQESFEAMPFIKLLNN